MPTLAELICIAIFSIHMPNADFACKHMDAVVEYSEKYDIDPILLTAMIYTESRWNPKVESWRLWTNSNHSKVVKEIWICELQPA